MARYEHDYYHQIERDDIENVPGNPWVICTLWQALHCIAAAESVAELEQALPYLQWTLDRALESGVLAEQFDPYTAEPISVSPLTWSHATVMTVVMRYLIKHGRLTGRRAGAMAELQNQELQNPA
jgi:GH15 family glucan-1,4-alpha-glucosidase